MKEGREVGRLLQKEDDGRKEHDGKKKGRKEHDGRRKEGRTMMDERKERKEGRK